jgi:hypothetical protein
MAVGISTVLAAEWLDAAFNNGSYAVAQAYIKLHVGDPGANGTANAATETTRKAISAAAASGGTITTDADLAWTLVGGSEDYTHFSVWDHLTAGNFLWSGTMTANAVTAGDSFTIPAGDLDFSLTVAS